MALRALFYDMRRCGRHSISSPESLKGCCRLGMVFCSDVFRSISWPAIYRVPEPRLTVNSIKDTCNVNFSITRIFMFALAACLTSSLTKPYHQPMSLALAGMFGLQ